MKPSISLPRQVNVRNANDTVEICGQKCSSTISPHSETHQVKEPCIDHLA